jgi:hypothetical protein
MDLTVTKVVEGDFSDVTDRFDFTVSGLENGDICNVERYVTVDGTTWTADGAPGTLTADASGVLSFSLAHYEKIVISIPSGTQVTLTETSHGYYHPSYAVDADAGTDGAAVTVTMDDDRTVAFTNTYNAVSPSGLSFRVIPFFIILSMSALLIPGLIVGRRKRREEE